MPGMIGGSGQQYVIAAAFPATQFKSGDRVILELELVSVSDKWCASFL